MADQWLIGSRPGLKYERKTKNTMTKKQLSDDMIWAQSRMEMANAFWRYLVKIDMIKAWKIEATRRDRKPKNMFIEATMQAYGKRDSGIETFNAMHFSIGQLARLKNPDMIDNADGSYTLRWQNNVRGNHSRPDDQLFVGVVFEGYPFGIYPAEGITAYRVDGEATFRLPEDEEFTGHAHLYAYFVATDEQLFSPDDHFVIKRS